MSSTRHPFDDNTQLFSKSRHELAALILLTLAGLCCMSINIADPDLWGHVQFGRDVLRDGFIQPTTSYSFTAEGYRWINHENLSEILLAFTFDNLGIAGLIWGKLLLAVVLSFLIIRCCFKNGVGGLVAGLTVLLVAINLSLHWHFRPQLASFLFFALMLWNLDYCFRDWHEGLINPSSDFARERSRRLRWLWLMPIVFWLWANSHGGFVAGVGILVIYLGGRAAEAVYYRRRNSKAIVLRLALIGGACVLATLVNPYGPDLHLWLIQSLGEPRPEIRDWHPIGWSTPSGTRFLVIMVLSGLSLAASKRRKDWTQILILALVCWQACAHVRHIAFFVLLFGFWIPVHFQSLLLEVKKRFSFRLKGVSREHSGEPAWLKWSYAACVCFLIVFCLRRSTDLTVDRANFPVGAFEYIADHNLNGRMVVTYNWAQYAIGAFGGENGGLPICPVAFDGRFRTCYPQQIVDMHFDFVIGDQGPGSRNRGIESGPLNDTKVLEYRQPDLVLISRRQQPSVDVMERQSDEWRLLYQDKLAQVWGRRSVFDDPTIPGFIPDFDREISNRAPTGTATWPAIPTKSDISRNHRDRLAIILVPKITLASN